MSSIKKAYLMWVGAEHYPTIKDWVDEVDAMGVSKRLPNSEMAKALTEEGAVVFVAHDEGNYHECPACVGETECPTCRLIDQQIGRWTKEVHDFKKKGVPETDVKIVRRAEKIVKASAEIKACPECGGKMKGKMSTGGTVEFENGTKMDYRAYNYWLHQPKQWKPEDHGGVKNDGMCEACGGRGRLPDGVVFGVFLPSGVEYILSPADTEQVKNELEAANITTVEVAKAKVEKRRKCGFRKPGGYYVVTHTGASSKSTDEVIKELVDKGAISPEVEVKGNFVQFIQPVEIDAKRFRGIKRWSLLPEAEDEAQMILDGLE